MTEMKSGRAGDAAQGQRGTGIGMAAGDAGAAGAAKAADDAGAEPKSEGQLLAERLTYATKNIWENDDAETRKSSFDFAEGYKAFLDAGKTEREFTAEGLRALIAAGYMDIDSLLARGKKLAPGTKVYQCVHGKSLLFALVGRAPVEDGVNVVGAHVDSPRIDLKTNPLYEDTEFAMLDTQYYGGIKKYQWVTIPLALHGFVSRKDGTDVRVVIGEDGGDPVFTITDLLPHLAKDQMDKKANEFIPGEGLNALAGSMPYRDKKAKDKVKLNALKLLNDRFGMVEEDFTSAEFELVPAGKARDVGLDRSMVGAYGHDDRSCAYAALKAVIDMADGAKEAQASAAVQQSSAPRKIGRPSKADLLARNAARTAAAHLTEPVSAPLRTCVGVLTDKEEIGSYGNTGAESAAFENFIAYLCRLDQGAAYSDISLRRCLAASSMLSADVNAALDPNWEGVQDKKTASCLGRGIVITKYTGGRGKGGASDANAEFVGKVRRILNESGVPWQLGDLGKVDQGGGGTIALHIARLGVQVLDCGIPVLSMHAPFEVISKADLYATYKGYRAFLEKA